MALHIEERVVGSVYILDLSGELTVGSGDLLDDVLSKLLFKGVREFILNCKDLRQIDPSGLSQLVKTWVQVKEHSGELYLLCVPEATKDDLRLARLSWPYDTRSIYEDELEAIEQLKVIGDSV